MNTQLEQLKQLAADLNAITTDLRVKVNILRSGMDLASQLNALNDVKEALTNLADSLPAEVPDTTQP